jgi:hypothetical protein
MDKRALEYELRTLVLKLYHGMLSEDITVHQEVREEVIADIDKLVAKLRAEDK